MSEQDQQPQPTSDQILNEPATVENCQADYQAAQERRDQQDHRH